MSQVNVISQTKELVIRHGNVAMEGIKHDRKAQVISASGAAIVLGGIVFGLKSLALMGFGAFCAGCYTGYKAEMEASKAKISLPPAPTIEE